MFFCDWSVFLKDNFFCKHTSIVLHLFTVDLWFMFNCSKGWYFFKFVMIEIHFTLSLKIIMLQRIFNWVPEKEDFSAKESGRGNAFENQAAEKGHEEGSKHICYELLYIL